ncbi:hypothetical protein ASPZODRAFT_131727 [Penicilliopsis zonata CBS 506.65]|uniref:Altered inheritance of mitochondria protein 6 n=1 Tax=Penicilliopsis zonata CBS 506.65 TaxID=1073090 RepID=A0A1L9SI96_9EURO|nr:hypothetical protein ASPZODRAFT_131727 [Penicilliopsis zonata CBS 506.65]OJJ46836.1 hypothetical protein ASPZODRAFT_131727 [Penicilliopsis zonata CBS 506.65]
MILGIVKFLSIAWSSVVLLFLDDLDSNLDSWVFPGGRPSIFSHWTTHGVVPVQCHSHNDYWRPVPLYSAIEAGCIGVEADIWLSDDELLVGHNRFTLHDAVTLRSLYLNPLLELLQTHNTRSSRLQPETLDADGTQHGGKGEEDSAPAGVFANNPYQTLALLIDFKTAGETTWPHLVKQLEPLREAGFLTFFNGVEVVNRPITVVVTGDAPFDHVLLATNTTHRDIFFDAPLDQLLEAEGDVYNYTNSDYASVDFRKTIGHLASNRFSQGQLDLVRAQVDAAHARGLRVRYWGTPTWPRGLRNHVWHVLVREQVDLINTDDLREGTMQDWRKHRSWFF